MKRLILFEIILIFFATTFETDSPPGWFQQFLPRNDLILSDIFFLDSATGWTTGKKYPAEDSSFVYKTMDGGNNWVEQHKIRGWYNTIQFLDANTGYIAGDIGFGSIYKSTNGGNNWNMISNFGDGFIDLFFVSSDTGWICDNDRYFGVGLLKTTNGGFNWQQQLDASFRPARVFFLNNDTGWVAGGNISATLYRTTNGGTNWSPQYTFPQQINDVFFFNDSIGIVTSGQNHRTTDGGFTWTQSNLGGIKISKGSDSVIWAGTNSFQRIRKSTNGGAFWFSQTSPVGNNSYTSAIDSLIAWAGGNGLVHTTDGGGPPIGILYAGTEAKSYSLEQNFPNPFNPTTIIFFTLYEKSTVELKVYNILGEQVAEMIDDDHFTSGVYQYGFDASDYDLTSGVYFYRLTARSEVSGNVFSDSKKMILLK
jgi:photosystem II stability/assembly factor-like uncharacterized protein